MSRPTRTRERLASRDMKRFSHLFLLLHLTAAFAAAQNSADAPQEAVDKIRYQLILPEEKTPEVVKPNEPNPFNKGESNALKAEDSSSEENKVKEVMLGMRSTGVVLDPADGEVRSVMLGPFKLERGMTVPAVLSDQEVRLRVNSLSDTAIELFWIEKKKNTALPPRPVIIPINIKPAVRYHLPTPLAADSAKSLNRPYGLQTQPEQSQPAAQPAPGTGAAGASAGASAKAPPRAIPVDESGTSSPPSSKKEVVEKAVISTPADSKNADQKQQQQAPETHPANLFMKLLMDKAMPTQQQQPQVK